MAVSGRGPTPPPRPGGGARPAPGRPGGGIGGDPRAGAPAAPGARTPFSPPPVIAWESRLGRLEAAVEEFRVETERYRNGALPIPPEELRTRIQRELRELRGVAVRSASDQFRLGSLEARFNSFSELYGRRVREREEGRGVVIPPRPASESPQHDPQSGIVFRGEPESAAVEALWSGLVASGGGARIELETFRGYITKQLGDIRIKTGVAAVQFRVVSEEGKLKLKAKPLAAGENG